MSLFSVQADSELSTTQGGASSQVEQSAGTEDNFEALFLADVISGSAPILSTIGINSLVDSQSWPKTVWGTARKLASKTLGGLLAGMAIQLVVNFTLRRRTWGDETSLEGLLQNAEGTSLSVFGIVVAGSASSHIYKGLSLASSALSMTSLTSFRAISFLGKVIGPAGLATTYGLIAGASTASLEKLYCWLHDETGRNGYEIFMSILFSGVSGNIGGRIALFRQSLGYEGSRTAGVLEYLSDSVTGSITTVAEHFIVKFEFLGWLEIIKGAFIDGAVSYGAGRMQLAEKDNTATNIKDLVEINNIIESPNPSNTEIKLTASYCYNLAHEPEGFISAVSKPEILDSIATKRVRHSAVNDSIQMRNFCTYLIDDLQNNFESRTAQLVKLLTISYNRNALLHKEIVDNINTIWFERNPQFEIAIDWNYLQKFQLTVWQILEQTEQQKTTIANEENHLINFVTATTNHDVIYPLIASEQNLFDSQTTENSPHTIAHQRIAKTITDRLITKLKNKSLSFADFSKLFGNNIDDTQKPAVLLYLAKKLKLEISKQPTVESLYQSVNSHLAEILENKYPGFEITGHNFLGPDTAESQLTIKYQRQPIYDSIGAGIQSDASIKATSEIFLEQHGASEQFNELIKDLAIPKPNFTHELSSTELESHISYLRNFSSQSSPFFDDRLVTLIDFAQRHLGVRVVFDATQGYYIDSSITAEHDRHNSIFRFSEYLKTNQAREQLINLFYFKLIPIVANKQYLPRELQQSDMNFLNDLQKWLYHDLPIPSKTDVDAGEIHIINISDLMEEGSPQGLLLYLQNYAENIKQSVRPQELGTLLQQIANNERGYHHEPRSPQAPLVNEEQTDALVIKLNQLCKIAPEEPTAFIYASNELAKIANTFAIHAYPGNSGITVYHYENKDSISVLVPQLKLAATYYTVDYLFSHALQQQYNITIPRSFNSEQRLISTIEYLSRRRPRYDDSQRVEFHSPELNEIFRDLLKDLTTDNVVSYSSISDVRALIRQTRRRVRELISSVDDRPV